MADRDCVASLSFPDGTVIDSWDSFTLRDTYTDPVGTLDFTVRPTDARISLYKRLMVKGELVVLKINNAPQSTNVIQTITKTVSKDGGLTFKLRCCGKLIATVQGSVDPKLSIHTASDSPVKAAILAALAPYGFTEIVDNDQANYDVITGKTHRKSSEKTIVSALKQKDAQAHDDETAYGFCKRLITRLGVCLKLTWDGKLMVTKPNYTQDALYSLVEDTDGSLSGDRFVDEIELVDTNDDQFSTCTVRGSKAEDKGETFSSTPESTILTSILNPNHPQYVSGAQPYKPLIIRDKNARDRNRCTSVAKLAMGLKASKAYVLSGTVMGFMSQTGAIWSVDTLAFVYSKTLGINEEMWIMERVFTSSRHQGQRTHLKLIPKGALQLGELPTS